MGKQNNDNEFFLFQNAATYFDFIWLITLGKILFKIMQNFLEKKKRPSVTFNATDKQYLVYILSSIALSAEVGGEKKRAFLQEYSF